MSDYIRRVAVHGHIPSDDIPDDIESTDDETRFDATIEIIYRRHDDSYWIVARHRQTIFLRYEWDVTDFSEAIDIAIETARDEDYPLQRTVYSWIPESDADNEIGAERINQPWEAADEEEDD